MLRNFGGFRVRKPRSYPGQESLPSAPKSKGNSKPKTIRKKPHEPDRPDRRPPSHFVSQIEAQVEARQKRKRAIINKVEAAETKAQKRREKANQRRDEVRARRPVEKTSS